MKASAYKAALKRALAAPPQPPNDYIDVCKRLLRADPYFAQTPEVLMGAAVVLDAGNRLHVCEGWKAVVTKEEDEDGREEYRLVLYPPRLLSEELDAQLEDILRVYDWELKDFHDHRFGFAHYIAYSPIAPKDDYYYDERRD